ncbi:MAG TPA: DUF6510 family protein [Acidimicrobiia bacterium]
MDGERHLDGNSLGGTLWDLFGREMTGEEGGCGECGAVGLLGQLVVYRDAPGEVARCSSCGAVSIVVVPTPDGLRVTFESIRWVSVGAGNG